MIAIRFVQHQSFLAYTLIIVIAATGMLSPGLIYAMDYWSQTPAQGMADVAVSISAQDTKIWLVGKNGTIWFSADQGDTFTQIEANGFRRISVGSDGVLWAVGSNETLWKFQRGSWTQTAASGMSDIGAGFNKIWLVGTNRTVWTSETGQHFQQDKDANGFVSIASGFTGTWAVGHNGTLWRFVPDDLH